MFGKEKSEKHGYSNSDGDEPTYEVGPVTDAVFGEIADGSPNYRSVGTLGAFILMTKANLGLGVLALPQVFSTLGMVPGILVIIAVQTIVIFCASVIGDFKMRHPEVYTLADAGRVCAGAPGWWFLYITLFIFMVFITGSALVGVSTALNAVSAHGTCTAVFIAVAAVAGFFLGSIRTLGQISWIGWLGIFSIMTAIITLTVSVGVQDKPDKVIQLGLGDDWVKEVKIIASPSFAEAMSALNNIVFSYGGTPMYFGIVSEMRDPRKFRVPMIMSVLFLTVVYLVIGSIVYSYCGQYIASPALGSAGVVMKKVCYGIAIPGLLASLTIFVHICGKNIFVLVLAGSRHLTSNTPTHWMTWLSCTGGSVIVGYIIASAIPIFGSLIGFIGALICPIVVVMPYNIMWFKDNWHRRSSWTLFNKMNAAAHVVVFCIGLFLCGAGTYGAVLELIATTSDQRPWSCADNSGSVKATS